MKPAKRAQIDVDDTQDDYSLASGLDCSEQPDTARQEFREEADVNVMLRRYGMAVPQVARAPQFGDQDFDLDLHSAHIALDRAGHAFRQLSPELREKYKDTAGLLDAMNRGELADDLRKERDKKEREEARRKAALEAEDKPEPTPTPPEAPKAPPKGS